jgi:hypothetical protein
MCLNTILIIESTSANSNAQPKLSTVNPGTMRLANHARKALITNVNNPRVITVTGKVKIIKIGLISKLRAASTIAKIKAVIKLDTPT